MLPETQQRPTPFIIKRKENSVVAFGTVETARDVLSNLDDSVRREKDLKPHNSPHHLQYTHVTSDVVRYEDLFDHGVTQQLIRLLMVKESIQDIIDDTLRSINTGGVIGLRDVYALIEELDDRDKLEGLSIRKICVQSVQEYLMKRFENTTELNIF